MDWKNTPPRHAGFYLASRDHTGDHVRHWDGQAWSTPLDLRDVDEPALTRMEHGTHTVRDAGINWLCSITFTLDFMVNLPGGVQPVPDDAQVRIIQGGVMYQGHAGGYRHWGEPCCYTLLEPNDPAPAADARGLDSARLLEAAAQRVRETQSLPPSAQELESVVRTFNNLFGANLTETQAWSFLAMLEVLRADGSNKRKAA